MTSLFSSKYIAFIKALDLDEAFFNTAKISILYILSVSTFTILEISEDKLPLCVPINTLKSPSLFLSSSASTSTFPSICQLSNEPLSKLPFIILILFFSLML